MSKVYFGQFKKCPCCNKEKFIVDIASYAYKTENRYFCSWNCFREFQREHPYITKRHYNAI